MESREVNSGFINHCKPNQGRYYQCLGGTGNDDKSLLLIFTKQFVELVSVGH